MYLLSVTLLCAYGALQEIFCYAGEPDRHDHARNVFSEMFIYFIIAARGRGVCLPGTQVYSFK